MSKLGCSTRILTISIIVLVALLAVGFVSGALGRAFIGESPWDVLSPIQPAPELSSAHEAEVTGMMIPLVGGYSFPLSACFIATWITIIVLVLFFWLVTRKAKLVPGRLQCLAEWPIEWVLSLCDDAAETKEDARRFFPVICTLFLFVMINAWLALLPIFNAIGWHHGDALIPFLRNANTDINVPLSLALLSAVFVEYWGMSSLGTFNYLSRFFNPSPLLSALKNIFTGKIKSGAGAFLNAIIGLFTGVLEALSEFIRIVSFTFRLFGNMTGGEILLLTMLFLFPFVIPLAFYALELLVGFVQALIFGGLTLGFAVIAVTPHGAEE